MESHSKEAIINSGSRVPMSSSGVGTNALVLRCQKSLLTVYIYTNSKYKTKTISKGDITKTYNKNMEQYIEFFSLLSYNVFLLWKKIHIYFAFCYSSL